MIIGMQCGKSSKLINFEKLGIESEYWGKLTGTVNELIE